MVMVVVLGVPRAPVMSPVVVAVVAVGVGEMSGTQQKPEDQACKS